MKTRISPSIDSTSIGLVVQLNNAEDTSEMTHTIMESLNDCNMKPVTGLFKNEVFQKENFDLLFAMDSTFISSQRTLQNLSQILVVKLEYKDKKDDVTGKKTFGITFLARWISFSPMKKIHDFYYAEKMEPTGTGQDRAMVNSFLAGQIHVKFCFEIKNYVFKKN